jgi:hypothetical protein
VTDHPSPNTVPTRANASILADAALRYTIAGWPVLPVRLPAPAHSPDLSLRAMVSHHPPADADTAQDWWGGPHPYGIAALVGIHFDVVAVPTRIGPATLTQLRRTPATVIEHPGGWWLYLVTPDAPALTDLPRRSGITILRAGSYLPLPPTPLTAGLVEWAVRTTPLADLITPAPTNQPRLPHSLLVQQAAARATTSTR